MKVFKVTIYVISLYLICFASVLVAAEASTVETSYDSPPSGWFLGAGIGRVYPRLDDDASVASSGVEGWPNDAYKPVDLTNATQYSLFAGYQWLSGYQWFPAYSLSLGYTHVSPVDLKGVIFVASDPEFKDFKYQYELDQQLVMLNFKANIYNWHHLMPFVSLGVGLAINDVSNYSDKPIEKDFPLERNFGFKSASNTEFSGSIGAGLDYWFNKNFLASAHYEYRETGDANTGRGEGFLRNDSLSSHTSSNSVGIQLLYFFKQNN